MLPSTSTAEQQSSLCAAASLGNNTSAAAPWCGSSEVFLWPGRTVWVCSIVSVFFLQDIRNSCWQAFSDAWGYLVCRMNIRASKSWARPFRVTRTMRQLCGWRTSITCSYGWKTSRRTCGSTAMMSASSSPTCRYLPSKIEPSS